MVNCAYKNEQSQCSHKNVHTACQVVNDKICGICKFQSRQIDPIKLRETLPEVKEEMIRSEPNFPEQPGIIDIGISFLKSTAKHIMNGGKSVSKEVYEERLNICNGCEHRKGNRCDICSCNLGLKCARPLEECPIKKWLAQKGE